MEVTVCICTRDREAPLARALESLTAVEPSPGLEWEVLVIDNGSARPVAEGISGFSARLPLRVAQEPRGGLSLARNTAIGLARGEVVIFVDDDATVRPGWLAAYVDGSRRHSEAAFFGGPIVARITGGSPRQVEAARQAMPGLFGSLEPNRGEVTLQLGDAPLPWGANMAVRRSAFDGFRFDPELGRRPSNPAGAGEETCFLRDLLRAGHHGVWLPRAVLDHHVDGRRATRRTFVSFCRNVGWAQGRELALLRERDPAELEPQLVAKVRAFRMRYWKTPPWAPLARRWAALRDLTHLQGFLAGYREASSPAGPR